MVSKLVGEALVLGSVDVCSSVAYSCEESLGNGLPGAREVREDMYLSAVLDPGVTQAWKEGELHTVIFSAAWMMHHRSSHVGWPL